MSRRIFGWKFFRNGTWMAFPLDARRLDWIWWLCLMDGGGRNKKLIDNICYHHWLTLARHINITTTKTYKRFSYTMFESILGILITDNEVMYFNWRDETVIESRLAVTWTNDILLWTNLELRTTTLKICSFNQSQNRSDHYVFLIQSKAIFTVIGNS